MPDRKKSRADTTAALRERLAVADRQVDELTAALEATAPQTRELESLRAQIAAHEDTIAELRRSHDSMVVAYREQIGRLTTADGTGPGTVDDVYAD